MLGSVWLALGALLLGLLIGFRIGDGNVVTGVDPYTDAHAATVRPQWLQTVEYAGTAARRAGSWVLRAALSAGTGMCTSCRAPSSLHRLPQPLRAFAALDCPFALPLLVHPPSQTANRPTHPLAGLMVQHQSVAQSQHLIGCLLHDLLFRRQLTVRLAP